MHNCRTAGTYSAEQAKVVAMAGRYTAEEACTCC